MPLLVIEARQFLAPRRLVAIADPTEAQPCLPDGLTPSHSLVSHHGDVSMVLAIPLVVCIVELRLARKMKESSAPRTRADLRCTLSPDSGFCIQSLSAARGVKTARATRTAVVRTTEFPEFKVAIRCGKCRSTLASARL